MKLKFIRSLYFLVISSLLVLVNCTDPDDSGIDNSKELGTPIINEATDISSSGFKISWARVYQAASYKLDVSKSENFNSFINGYQSKLLDKFTEDLSGLEKATSYFVRVKALNNNGESAYSRVIKVTTLDEQVPQATAALKVAAATFYVGMAVKASQLDTGTKYDEILKKEFSSITAEYEMKMNIILPTKGNYDWSKADAIVNYAQANGINVHGHALIWHESTPDWLKNFTGTDAEFEQEVKDYISKVVTRYKGKIGSWDVVNEAINDSGGTLRQTVFSKRMGDNYIEKCFKFAREADPNVLLFYNDYSVTTNIPKQTAIFNLIDNLKSKNTPIDGVGFQMHIQYNSPTVNEMKTAVNKAVARGLKLHFSELDVRANPNKDLTTLTEERATAQKNKIKELVEIYNAIPLANKYAISIWGMRDSESWLLPFYNNYNEWPLLYDNNFQSKKTHTGFLEGLK